MKNIKIVISSFILASAIALASANAMAKTQGNSVNVNLAYNKSSHEYHINNMVSARYPQFDNSKIGFGLAYKYSFNYNNIFASPSIFFDQIGTEAKDRDDDTVSIGNRYGIKLDIGYDISDKLAIYGFGGLANTSYKVDWKSIEIKKSARETSPIVGAGLMFYPKENIYLNFEYSHQYMDLKTPLSHTKTETNIDSLKIGFGYQF